MWLLLALSVLGVRAQGLPVALAVWEDPGGQAGIDSIPALSAGRAFRPLPHGLSAGYTRSVHWLRFDVQPPAASALAAGPATVFVEVQPPYLDDLRLFVPRGAGGFDEHRSGDLLPFDDRPVVARGFIFPVAFERPEPLTLYLRVATDSSTLVIVRQWQPREFQAAQSLEYALLGGGAGVFLILMIASLWHGAWRTDALYRSYLAFIVCALFYLTSSAGLVAQFLAPGSPLVGHHATSLSSILLGAASVDFYRRVLDIDGRLPWLDGLYRGVFWVSLACLGLALVGLYPLAAGLLMPLLAVISVLGLLRSVWLARRGQPGANFLVLGHGFALLGGVSVSLALLGVLPGQFWLVSGFQVGALFTALSMTAVMARRLRAVESSRRASEERARLAEVSVLAERQARRAQSRFFAIFSHELTTPLAMIDGAAQSLGVLLGPQPDSQVQRRLERVRKAVRRILDLSRSLLDKDRIDAEQLVLRPRPVDLVAVCRQAADQQEGADRIEVSGPSRVLAMADPALLHMALGNLMSNALKYSPPGTPVRVEVHLQDDGRTPRIDVMDRGQGVPASLAGSLFDGYVRGEHGDRVPGVGLGLYIVQRIAQLHGGSVRHANLPAGGARFTLILPQATRLEGDGL